MIDDIYDEHCLDGPTMVWRDGAEDFYLENLKVNREYIEKPLTVDAISNERNAEVRRVLMKMFGEENFVLQSRYDVIDRDVDEYDKERKLLHVWNDDDEALVMVEVRCTTTNEKYIIRVPPHITTCKEAVAWTFRETIDTYKPDVQT